ncbi:Yip1-domain-containing protein [Hyphopichia burtonii NRRL Y-1933]|uniref:Protein YIP n=1 Tax=Hyphopichia burtonii NRRL Y-1933 TaxID=984485 RepID=A0A1E4RFT9_9ASCO|nr:Yip1-domain-containing protein [Hyphopichia burtonii NRRL Y-1933]ODV66091.1 Yip1-domain-containing protein [Hyphopichia burtonii NRRL Y-1933]
MSQWNNNQTPAADDFIIPDEATPVNTSANATSTNKNTSSNNTNSSSNIFSQFNWGPKVDLSSTFTPFTNSSAFQENNTIRERQYTGGDTLDEPVWATLKRDLLQIVRRLAIVIWPMQLAQLALKQQQKFIDFASTNGINLPESIINNRRISVSHDDDDYDHLDTENNGGLASDDNVKQGNLDWDLWGPLIFSLFYTVTLALSAPNKQTNKVFSGAFAFIWLFFIVIGLNIQLLGGNISFMSAISASGYSMFPIVIGSLVSTLFISWRLIRLAIMSILCAWSVYAGVMSLKCSGVLPGRVLLAIYPVGLMYAVLSWLVIIT